MPSTGQQSIVTNVNNYCWHRTDATFKTRSVHFFQHHCDIQVLQFLKTFSRVHADLVNYSDMQVLQLYSQGPCGPGQLVNPRSTGPACLTPEVSAQEWSYAQTVSLGRCQIPPWWRRWLGSCSWRWLGSWRSWRPGRVKQPWGPWWGGASHLVETNNEASFTSKKAWRSTGAFANTRANSGKNFKKKRKKETLRSRCHLKRWLRRVWDNAFFS